MLISESEVCVPLEMEGMAVRRAQRSTGKYRELGTAGQGKGILLVMSGAGLKQSHSASDVFQYR